MAIDGDPTREYAQQLSLRIPGLSVLKAGFVSLTNSLHLKEIKGMRMLTLKISMVVGGVGAILIMHHQPRSMIVGGDPTRMCDNLLVNLGSFVRQALSLCLFDQ